MSGAKRATSPLRKGAIILAPHADDETLACGGLIAEMALRRLPFLVFVATDGAASHPGGPAWPASRLAALRRREVAAAMRRLGAGVRHLRFLDFPDGAMNAGGSALRRAAATLARSLRRLRVRVLIAPASTDSHPDHRACHALALAACRAARAGLLTYAVWGPLPAGAAWGLPVLRHGRRRAAALACHRSQIGEGPPGLGGGFRIPPDLHRMTRRGIERFHLERT